MSHYSRTHTKIERTNNKYVRPLNDYERIYYYRILKETTDKAYYVDSVGFGRIWLPKSQVRNNVKEEYFKVPLWLYTNYNDRVLV